jgi:hypothetical protein
MVMLVGQYSTGKTTFIRYLLEQDFPGIRIGPEPTTDRYVVLLQFAASGLGQDLQPSAQDQDGTTAFLTVPGLVFAE